MGLKDWVDKVDGVDDILAEDINSVAHAVIDATQRIKELENEIIKKDYVNNLFSNALKGQASGETIGLSDVSPIEHTLNVKLEAEDGIELPTLKTYGKNLLDPNLLVEASGKVQDDGSIKFDPISKEHTVLYRGNGSTDRVTISFDIQTQYDASQGYGQRFRIFYEGSSNATSVGSVVSVGTFSPYSVATAAGRVVDRIELDYGDTKNPTWLKNVQFEIGVTKTEYETFRGEEYTPNADGTVDGVRSIYPNMVLKTDTDGVIINAEYNRDLNKAFSSLYSFVSNSSEE